MQCCGSVSAEEGRHGALSRQMALEAVGGGSTAEAEAVLIRGEAPHVRDVSYRITTSSNMWSLPLARSMTMSMQGLKDKSTADPKSLATDKNMFRMV